jgi:hypothetical protein
MTALGARKRVVEPRAGVQRFQPRIARERGVAEKTHIDRAVELRERRGGGAKAGVGARNVIPIRDRVARRELVEQPDALLMSPFGSSGGTD